MSRYLAHAYDCLDEHETRYRRLSREDRRRARAWEANPTTLDGQLRQRADELVPRLLEAAKERRWRDVVRWATALVDVEARLDLIREVCEAAPDA